MEKTISINDSTKISELIRADKAVIDVIAGVAKPFHRLRNPVLRAVMAPRVTIAEAAKMGGCTVDAIVAALVPLGFAYEAAATGAEAAPSIPRWLLLAKAGDITRYDVRPVLESGTDPLKEILGAFKNISPGGILCIVNSFVPTPLIRLLEQEKAEGSYVETISNEEFHTYFLKKRKEGPAQADTGDKVIIDDAEAFQAVYRRFPQAQIRETDVRHLEMPLPMQTILGALETLPEGHMLYVHHKRIPVYLLEELADRHYEVHIHTVDDSNVKMILFER